VLLFAEVLYISSLAGPHIS